jgi:hypothetical protein
LLQSPPLVTSVELNTGKFDSLVVTVAIRRLLR